MENLKETTVENTADIEEDGVFCEMDNNGACSNRSGGEGPTEHILN